MANQGKDKLRSGMNFALMSATGVRALKHPKP